MFNIRMGIPEMKKFWDTLSEKVNTGKAGKNELKIYKKLGKAFKLIAQNPRHPGLQTHEIKKLTEKVGKKVWQSYLENNTPGAGRIFWLYGPGRNDITIIAFEPHPDDKPGYYDKVILSDVKDIEH